jgi:UDP-glucose 4-epimerase
LIEIGALAEIVRSRLSSESEIRRIPYAEAFDEGFEDLRVRQPDLDRVRKAIGFKAKIALETTIDDLARSLEARKIDQ